MSPNSKNLSWDGFKDRAAAVPQGANLEDQLRASIVRVNAKAARKPKATPPAEAAPEVGDLLLHLIQMVSSRKGKESRETMIREAALFDALGAVMRGAA